MNIVSVAYFRSRLTYPSWMQLNEFSVVTLPSFFDEYSLYYELKGNTWLITAFLCICLGRSWTIQNCVSKKRKLGSFCNFLLYMILFPQMKILLLNQFKSSNVQIIICACNRIWRYILQKNYTVINPFFI